jgi:RimJ/RimL family protein N-acetyltransferase
MLRDTTRDRISGVSHPPRNVLQNEPPTLNTSRLRLVPLAMEHARDIQTFIDDWDVVRWLQHVPWPYPPDGAESFIGKCLASPAGTNAVWSIQPQDNPGQTMGLIHYWLQSEKQLWTRGFWLGLPFQKKGFMTEAVTAANDWVFANGLERIEIRNLVDNAASQKIKLKTGTVWLREETCHGALVDVWELSSDQWQRFRGRPKASC